MKAVRCLICRSSFRSPRAWMKHKCVNVPMIHTKHMSKKRIVYGATKIGVVGERFGSGWRIALLVGRRFLALQRERSQSGTCQFSRRSDCEKAAKAIAATLGCSYAVEK